MINVLIIIFTIISIHITNIRMNTIVNTADQRNLPSIQIFFWSQITIDWLISISLFLQMDSNIKIPVSALIYIITITNQRYKIHLWWERTAIFINNILFYGITSDHIIFHVTQKLYHKSYSSTVKSISHSNIYNVIINSDYILQWYFTTKFDSLQIPIELLLIFFINI